MLKEKNVLLGVTGSIAAYKAVELARSFISRGAHVKIVCTESAKRFVTPLTFASITSNPVASSLYDDPFAHLTLTRDADLFIIAPASANTINKLSCGIADNLLCTLWLGYEGPSLIAPAMNCRMYSSPAVKKSLDVLSGCGVHFVGPGDGSLACGDEGIGRLADIDEIVMASEKVLSKNDLQGHDIIVTAGPTVEAIDTVRFLSNRSSGKMGFAIAHAALIRGADVTLISGPNCLRPAQGLDYVPVQSAVEMQSAIMKHTRERSVIIMAAAVADYAPAVQHHQKLAKEDIDILELKQTPDILETLGKSRGQQLLIGFAAESGKNISRAKAKLERKHLDMIVLNDIAQEGAGFDVDTNIVTIIRSDGSTTDYPEMSKTDVAHNILDNVVQLMKG